MAEFNRSERKASFENEEFQEEDVWGVMKGRGRKPGKEHSSPTSASSACRIIPAPIPRAINPRVKRGNFESLSVLHHHQSSAPVNIPDWFKIHKEKSNSRNSNNYDHHDESFGKEEEEDEDSDELLPPHEMIARRAARNPVVSCSMCEGIGRTLKGRDLSRLRNAILTKTGFLE